MKRQHGVPPLDRFMLKQRTLRTTSTAVGVGLHTGKKVRIALSPAEPDTGIVFRRTDLPGGPEIRARAEFIGETRLSSCLVLGNVKVYTIEHLMSAFAGLGIDNARVDIDGPEVPIMDGSAAPFVLLLKEAGLRELAAAKKFLRVLRPVEVTDGDKYARLDPYEGFSLDFTIQFAHPVIEKSRQSVIVDFAKTSYLKEVGRARTFGFMHEVEQLRDAGLALGGGLDNAVVLDEYRVLNSEGLRFADEFIRHKVLDAIGDLYLLGMPILGAFRAYKSGHALNNRLLRAVAASAGGTEVVIFERDEETPPGVRGMVPVAA